MSSIESLKGMLLFSTPALFDPNFRRTVILVAEHGEDGAMGLVLNRPLGHTLVVPRLHVEDLWDGTPDAAAVVMTTAHEVAALLRRRLAPDGLTLRQNTGAASGQQVPHLHLHLVPRWHGDGTIGWPWPPPTDPDLPGLLARLLDAAPED